MQIHMKSVVDAVIVKVAPDLENVAGINIIKGFIPFYRVSRVRYIKVVV